MSPVNCCPCLCRYVIVQLCFCAADLTPLDGGLSLSAFDFFIIGPMFYLVFQGISISWRQGCLHIHLWFAEYIAGCT